MTATVRAKWPIALPDFCSAYVEFDPGVIIRRHGHLGHHVVFVIAGGAWFGDRWCPAGTHIELPDGAAFGPIVAGDEGMVDPRPHRRALGHLERLEARALRGVAARGEEHAHQCQAWPPTLVMVRWSTEMVVSNSSSPMP